MSGLVVGWSHAHRKGDGTTVYVAGPAWECESPYCKEEVKAWPKLLNEQEQKCIQGEHERDGQLYIPVGFGSIAVVCKHCRSLYVART